MNLILSDVEETITLVDVGDDGAVSNVRVSVPETGAGSDVVLKMSIGLGPVGREEHGDALRPRRRRHHGKIPKPPPSPLTQTDRG
jgi:hypothetical protein